MRPYRYCAGRVLRAMNDNADVLADAERQTVGAEVRIAGVQAHIAELELADHDAGAARKVLEES